MRCSGQQTSHYLAVPGGIEATTGDTVWRRSGRAAAGQDWIQPVVALSVLWSLLLAFGVAKAESRPIEVLHSFSVQPGGPRGEVFEGSDGALYGTTSVGGAHDSGTVFKVNRDGSGFLVLHDFNVADPADGAAPSARLVEGSDGALYGTTPTGGANGYGTVFKVGKDGAGFVILHDFSFEGDGANPQAGLIEGSDGDIYGTASAGGRVGSSNGTVFALSQDGSGFRVVHSFVGFEGAVPTGGLIERADGALYGTTYGGGTYRAGTVFSLKKNGSGFRRLHDFGSGNPEDGAGPIPGLLEGSDGVLYGTTYLGGANGAGIVFKVNADGTGFADLHDFKGNDPLDGHEVLAGLAEAANGLLYGTTFYGGAYEYGIIFSIRKDGTEFRNVHDFNADDSGNGRNPYAGLVLGSDDLLYGTAYLGGASENGVVFKINGDGTGFANLLNFGFGEGSHPYGGLLEASDGMLYGTTANGGPDGYGIVFKIDKDGTDYVRLHEFVRNDPANGATPTAVLIEGSDGALYGTTIFGGAYDDGIVFKINKDGSGFAILHDFKSPDYPNGFTPEGGLVEAADGALYGTTQSGGLFFFYGTIYRLNKDGTEFVTLYSFNYDDGASPYASLAKGSDRALYGTTSQGGTYGAGTAFRFSKDGLVTLHHFNFSTDGAYPHAGLVEGSDGALYGTTVDGGSPGYGTVFKVNKDGTGFLKLHDFTDSDGASPYGGLVAGPSGVLTGTTYEGGSLGYGTVFQVREDGTGFVVIHDFDNEDGADPYSGLVLGSDRRLYGTAFYGGAAAAGAVFRLTCEASTCAVPH